MATGFPGLLGYSSGYLHFFSMFKFRVVDHGNNDEFRQVGAV